jgi:hypothetical protein
MDATDRFFCRARSWNLLNRGWLVRPIRLLSPPISKRLSFLKVVVGPPEGSVKPAALFQLLSLWR